MKEIQKDLIGNKKIIHGVLAVLELNSKETQTNSRSHCEEIPSEIWANLKRFQGI